MIRWALIGVMVVLSVGLVLAQDTGEGDDTIKAEELGKDLKAHVGMGHTFRDVIAHIYSDLKQYPGFMKFDTANVRCRYAVPDREDWKLLDMWGRGEIDDIRGLGKKFKDTKLGLLWEVYFGEIRPQILSITGKVIEPSESGGFGFLHVFDVTDIERVKYRSRQ
jgi:hypothetical protein